jgi:hypothetical protein
MTRIRSGFRRIFNRPIRQIEALMGLTSLIGAAYLFTPLYAIGHAAHPSPLTTILTNSILIWGIVLALGAVLVLVGLFLESRRMRSTGLTLIFLSRLYQIIAIFIVVGPLPLQWLYPLTICLFCLVLRSHVRGGRQ